MFLFEEIVIPPSMTAVDIGAMLLEEHTDPMARLCQLGLLAYSDSNRNAKSVKS
jgi:hypothetical protein